MARDKYRVLKSYGKAKDSGHAQKIIQLLMAIYTPNKEHSPL